MVFLKKKVISVVKVTFSRSVYIFLGNEQTMAFWEGCTPSAVRLTDSTLVFPFEGHPFDTMEFNDSVQSHSRPFQPSVV